MPPAQRPRVPQVSRSSSPRPRRRASVPRCPQGCSPRPLRPALHRRSLARTSETQREEGGALPRTARAARHRTTPRFPPAQARGARSGDPVPMVTGRGAALTSCRSSPPAPLPTVPALRPCTTHLLLLFTCAHAHLVPITSNRVLRTCRSAISLPALDFHHTHRLLNIPPTNPSGLLPSLRYNFSLWFLLLFVCLI